MRIAFMGTPDFAVPSLKALLNSEDEVVLVICQPDRPKGRGYKLVPCPVKMVAEEAGVPVYQPERIKSPEGVQQLRDAAPDLCVTAAFGQLLSKENLEIPPLGTVNVHASLLPRHRGSAPVNWSILMGDRTTGVTTMMTDIGMDTGDILLRREVEIGESETAGELTDRLAALGADLLIETLDALRRGTLKRIPQDAALATVEPKLKKELGRIDFTRSAREIDCQVRGLSPWPGAYTTMGSAVLKVGAVRVLDGLSGTPGRVLFADAAKGLAVACRDGAVELTAIQAPGSRMMSARDYLRGHSINETVLGEEENAKQ